MTKPISSDARATWTSNGIQLAIIIATFAYGYGTLHSEVADTREDVKEIKQTLKERGFIAHNPSTNNFSASE